MKVKNVPRGNVPAGTFSRKRKIELNPWYVTGLCESEAVFTYSKTGKTFNIYLSIKQQKTNSELIEKIREFFGRAGSVYACGAVLYYRIVKAAELQNVVAHFDEYPLIGKAQEKYLVWRQMVQYKTKHYRKINRAALSGFAEQLSALHKPQVV